MESLFVGSFNKMTNYTLSFADPLVLGITQEADQSLAELKPGDLKITVISNELSPIVFETSVDYSAGPGLGSIDLRVDGIAALERYKESLLEDENAEPKFEGQVTLKVSDQSPGGLSSVFHLNFVIEGEELLISNKAIDDKAKNETT